MEKFAFDKEFDVLARILDLMVIICRHGSWDLVSNNESY